MEKGDIQTVYNPTNPQDQPLRIQDPNRWAFRNNWTFGNTYGAFYDPKALDDYAPSGTVRSITGTIRIGDTDCQVLTISKNPDYITERLYIAPDGTLRGVDLTIKRDGQTLTSRSRLTHVKVNAAISDKVFEFPTPSVKTRHFKKN